MLTIVLDGLAYGMVLFVISVGLTVTMGLMRVVNLAHGSFAMIGGYVAAAVVAAGYPFAAAVLAAMASAALAGLLAERFLFRRVYARGELPQALLTFGMTFVTIAALTMMFGSSIRVLPLPESLAGLIPMGDRQYPAYRVFLIVSGLVLSALLWWGIEKTSLGAYLRAAVDSPRMAAAVGIDVQRLFAIVFSIGCALAGLGAVLGAGIMPLEPYYALRYLVLFLVVVGVGGVGSFRGSLLAAMALGMIDTLAKFYLPALSAYIFYGVVLGLLLLRPHGLLPRRNAR